MKRKSLMSLARKERKTPQKYLMLDPLADPRDVMAVLRSSPLSMNDIAKTLTWPVGQVGVVLKKLIESGKVVEDAGVYSLSGPDQEGSDG